MHAAPPRSAGNPRGAIATLVALTAGLGVALVLAPSALAASAPGGGYANQGDLITALRAAFVEYWHSGDRALTPGLAHVVDYWFRFHVVKGVIGALLLAVLVALGIRLWRLFVSIGELRAGTRVALAAAGAVVGAAALFSLAVVMANIQGAVAPLSSALSMLPLGTPSGQLTSAVDQVRQHLSDYSSTAGQRLPAIDVMVDDFGRYHAVLVVIAATVATGFAGMSVALWMRFRRVAASDRQVRRALAVLGVLTALLSVAVFVVMGANISVATDPAPALLAFFQGGW
jgi:hypothetical protein